MNLIPTIAVLITCHNRKEKTVKCLQALFKQNGLGHEFNIQVFLVDDGSTDGTSDAIRVVYSEVNIIQGNGNLYWNRGMHLAWETAAASKDFDYYLWLNDDTYLYRNGLQLMLMALNETHFKSIICGSTCSPNDENKMTYGGSYLVSNKTIPIFPNGKIQKADIINGNCVLVPHIVYQKVGNLDWTFSHAIGDHDYGLRAKKLGFFSFSIGNFIGTCSDNSSLPKWCNPEFSIHERFKNLYSPLGYAEPFKFFKYQKRHFGLGKALKNFLTTHIRILFPKLW